MFFSISLRLKKQKVTGEIKKVLENRSCNVDFISIVNVGSLDASNVCKNLKLSNIKLAKLKQQSKPSHRLS